MARGTLYHISYSPWSERARWALRHHSVVHERKHYAPLIGEPGLRLKLGRPLVKVTLPVMFVDGGVLDDSYDIARYAERVGEGAPLFPASQLGRIRHYNERAQAILGPGRMAATARTLRNPAALRASLPPPLGKLGPLSTAIGRMGAGTLVTKYGLDTDDEEQLQERIRGELRRLRDELAASDSGFLCGDAFSYAEILMAGAFAFIQPVANEYIRLGSLVRGCWQDPPLADEFADLVAWRDDIYQRFRR